MTNKKMSLDQGKDHLILNSSISYFLDIDKLFIKHKNKIIKFSGSSIFIIEELLKLLKIPRTIAAILNSFSDFEEEDLMNLLRRLIECGIIKTDKENSSSLIQQCKESKFNIEFLDNNCLEQSHKHDLLIIGDGKIANTLINLCYQSILQFSEVKYSDFSKIYALDIDEIRNNLNKHLLKNNYDLVIVTQDYSNILLFEVINEILLNFNIPWVRINFDGYIGQCGPLVIPNETACYNCCQLRLINNNPKYDYLLWKYRHKMYKMKEELVVSQSCIEILSKNCMNEIMQFLTFNKSKLIDKLFIFDTVKGTFNDHIILSHPYCDYCKKRLREKSYIQSRNLSTLSESDLLLKLRTLIDSKTGIIKLTVKGFDTNEVGLINHHFYETVFSNPRIDLIDRIRVLESFGTGFTSTQAELRSLMESVERYSCMVYDESNFVYKSFNEISKKAIDPRDLVLYLDRQYDNPNFLCSRFSTNSRIPWITGYELPSNRKLLIPADFVYSHSIRNQPLVLGTSNGAAAHSNIYNAILNGLFELIERDAFLLMWYNKLSLPFIKLDNLSESFNESVQLINRHGLNIKLIDITSEFGIPTVMAIASGSTSNHPGLIVGCGCDLDPNMAIQKSLFEMELLLLSVLQHKELKKIPIHEISKPFDHCRYYLNSENTEKWEFMVKNKYESSLLDKKSSHNKSIKGIRKTVLELTRMLENRGHKIAYVNITPPDINLLNLHVVKVISTGLIPISFRIGYERLASERLYQYPKSILQNTQINLQDQLNMYPHPLA